jgi:stalled ribosome alternative rescue factor ArfA
MAVTSKTGRAKPKTGRRMKVKRTVKRRSATAAALASPLYRKRVVKSAKAYSRKGKARKLDAADEDA